MFCHDDADAALDRCPECEVCWHADCRASAARCPTIGCGAPVPAPEVTATRGSPPEPVTLERARWRRPSAAWTALHAALALLALLAIALPWLVGRPGDRSALVLSPCALLGLPALVAAARRAWLHARWSRAWRTVAGEVASGTPTLVRLDLTNELEAWLVGPERSLARVKLLGDELDHPLLGRSQLLCYGWPPPGPYGLALGEDVLLLVDR